MMISLNLSILYKRIYEQIKDNSKKIGYIETYIEISLY